MAAQTTSATGAAPKSDAVAPRRVLEMMREATGASDEDICVMLQLCGGDANEATTKLLESERRVPGPAGLSRARTGLPRADQASLPRTGTAAPGA